MPRRMGGRDRGVYDPRVRAGLIKRWQRAVAAFPTPGGREYLAGLRAGLSVELNAQSMFDALVMVDQEAARPFAFAHRAGNAGRLWLLTEEDLLIEVTDDPNYTPFNKKEN